MKKILNFKQHYFESTKQLNENATPYFMGDPGEYSHLYNLYYDAFVPRSGCSKYVIGELIRIVSRIIHEYYNNGNGNAAEYQYEDECYDTEVWDEEAQEYYTEEECEEVESSCEVSKFYDSMLNFAEEFGPKDISGTIDSIRRIICNSRNTSYDEKDNQYYTEFADKIIQFVRDNFQDKKLVQDADPEYYRMHHRD